MAEDAPHHQALPKEMRQWREDTERTQKRAAHDLGVSHRTYEGWELGDPMPYPRMLRCAMEGLAKRVSPAKELD